MKRQHIGRVKSGVYLEKRRKRSQHQARPDQQNETQRYLTHHQKISLALP